MIINLVVSNRYLVEGPGEEGGEGGGEDHGAVAARRARRHAHQRLLRDEALDVPAHSGSTKRRALKNISRLVAFTVTYLRPYYSYIFDHLDYYLTK